MDGSNFVRINYDGEVSSEDVALDAETSTFSDLFPTPIKNTVKKQAK